MSERYKDLDHEICHCLTWKSMFYQTGPDPKVLPSNEDNFWCALTQVCLGPDGQLAEPASCKPGRSCFYVLD